MLKLTGNATQALICPLEHHVCIHKPYGLLNVEQILNLKEESELRVIKLVFGYSDYDSLYAVAKVDEVAKRNLSNDGWFRERYAEPSAAVRRTEYLTYIEAAFRGPLEVMTLILGYMPFLTACCNDSEWEDGVETLTLH
jgi:hypothetical protein